MGVENWEEKERMAAIKENSQVWSQIPGMQHYSWRPGHMSTERATPPAVLAALLYSFTRVFMSGLTSASWNQNKSTF